MGKKESQQNKRPHEEIECEDEQQNQSIKIKQETNLQQSSSSSSSSATTLSSTKKTAMDKTNVKAEPNNNSNTIDDDDNSARSKNKSKQLSKSNNDSSSKDEEYDANDEDDDLDEEEVEEEEIEEEIEEEEEEDEEMDEDAPTTKKKSDANQAGGHNDSGANTASQTSLSGNNSSQDKRPRLTNELYEMNLRRKKEHVCSALYIPFPRKVSEEEVRAFVGQGPNIFIVGMQKLNAIVRYRTQVECEQQRKELAKKEFDGKLLTIEPKTVKIDPANIDVKTLIVQYSNPSLTIMDFAQIFIKATSISLKGGKSKKEGQEDLSFGSAIIIFPSHEEAKEAFLATENLSIKGEQLRVVFADFRPASGSVRSNSGSFTFRDKRGGDNRGNFNRNSQGGGNRQGGGNFRRSRNSNSGGGGSGNQRNFGGNRNFNQNSGGGGGGGGAGGSQYGGGQGRNFNNPNKKFRSNRH